MRSFQALADLIVPTHCAGCATPGGPWCPTCAGTLQSPAPVTRPGVRDAYALAAYEGPPRRAVLAYKERSRRELARHFGRSLAAAIPTLTRAGPVTLIPAPSRPAAARKRGGQHMVAVAKHCATTLRAAGVPTTVTQALRLNGQATDSIGLAAQERAANLAGRLHPVPGRAPPPGTQVILLDDVITTGATAVACTRALATTGVEVTHVLALTATT